MSTTRTADDPGPPEFERGLADLGEPVADDTFAQELYAALCNMRWRRIGAEVDDGGEFARTAGSTPVAGATPAGSSPSFATPTSASTPGRCRRARAVSRADNRKARTARWPTPATRTTSTGTARASRAGASARASSARGSRASSASAAGSRVPGPTPRSDGQSRSDHRCSRGGSPLTERTSLNSGGRI